MFQAKPLAVVLCFLLIAAAQHASAVDVIKNYGGNNYTFIDYSFYGTPGRLYIPDGYDPNTPTALVTMFHGIGEAYGSYGSGDPRYNTAQLNSAISNLTINANARNYLLYVPQSEVGWWAEQYINVKVMGKIATEYNVDLSRIYLTGLSGGGHGVINAIRDYSTLYAAFVPMSVTGENFTNATTGEPAAFRPTWYHVGAASGDNWYLGQTRINVNGTLDAMGYAHPSYPTQGQNVAYTYMSPDGSLRYTQILNGGHNNTTWNSGTWGNPDVVNWMLAQNNGYTTPSGANKTFMTFDPGNHTGHVDLSNRTWNNPIYHSPTTEGVFMVLGMDETGQRNTTIFELADAFETSGTTGVPGGAAYDFTVARTYWRLTAGGDDHAQIIIHGLGAGNAYELGIFAFTNQPISGQDYVGVYNANGVQVVIDAEGNLDEETLYVLADAMGRIVLNIDVADGSDNAILNTLSLLAVPEPGTLGVFSLLGALGLRRRRA